MPGYLFSNSLLMLERAMDYQWTKFSVISDNIVNAETPNCKPKYVTFEEALRAQIRNAVRGTDTEAKAGSMRAVLTAARPSVHVADDESARMDENGVNVSEQSMELVRNAYQVQHVYRAISSDMSRLMLAIRGQ